MKLFAVIPTAGERRHLLSPMVKQLTGDGVSVILVDNRRDEKENDASMGVSYAPGNPPYVHRHVWAQDEAVNLSRMWNIGLDWAEELASGEEFVVAVFNDDLTLPAGIVQKLAEGIMTMDVAASYVLPYGTVAKTMLVDDPLTLGNRMVGYAFALRGSRKLRADESFLWWWGDTDLDLRARDAGGVVGLPIFGLEHHDPNGYTNRTPAFTLQAGLDRETFYRKWGWLPW